MTTETTYLTGAPALANTVRILQEARAEAVKGGAPSLVLSGIDSCVSTLLARIEQAGAPPVIAPQTSIGAVNLMNGWVPMIEVQDDPHWPACFEKRDGYARRSKSCANEGRLRWQDPARG